MLLRFKSFILGEAHTAAELVSARQVHRDARSVHVNPADGHPFRARDLVTGKEGAAKGRKAATRHQQAIRASLTTKPNPDAKPSKKKERQKRGNWTSPPDVGLNKRAHRWAELEMSEAQTTHP